MTDYKKNASSQLGWARAHRYTYFEGGGHATPPPYAFTKGKGFHPLAIRLLGREGACRPLVFAGYGPGDPIPRAQKE